MTETDKKPKILLISSAESDETRAINDSFVQSLNEELDGAAEVSWQNYHAIGLEMGSGGKLEAFLIATGESLAGFRLVYFKSYFRYHEQATAIAEALLHHQVQFVGNELRQYIPAHKLSQMARLARSGLPIPYTIYLPTEHVLSHFADLQARLGERFIFKAIDGSTGEDNYLITSQEQLVGIIAADPARHYIAQAFIPNDSDLRVVVLSGDIKLLIERRRKDDTTHLNNTSQGASARLLPVAELNPELQQLSRQAAKIMNRDVAGVDLMLERGTGKPYILEVNASPQIGSGAFVKEKLAVYSNYFKNMLK